MQSAAILISFIFFLITFVCVGIYSATRRKTTTEDYLLASRSVGPWLMGLSAVATNNSGYMFIGLIGWTYAVGISSMWIMVGWIGGDYLAWRMVHRHVRTRSQEENWLTVPSFLGDGLDGRHEWVVRLSAIILLVFLGIYSAAQLKAGSKALHVLFGWDISLGAIIGAVIVVLYCFAGGIRASIWTDALQAVLMLGSMVLLLFVAEENIGGFGTLWSRLIEIDPNLVNFIPQGLEFGFAAYLMGWMFAGFGVVGQPHIMVRAMVIDDADHLVKARRVYFLWYVMFSAACIAVGLTARVLLVSRLDFDAELALPALSVELLPSVLVGLILAGLFSATMSTADSQILSCSAAVTQDMFPRWRNSYWIAKAGTLGVAALVLGIALAGSANVFSLVVLAWSALAAALGPLMVVRAFRWPVDTRTGLSMILAGLASMLFWRYGLGLSASIFEGLPGMLAGFLIYYVLRPR